MAWALYAVPTTERAALDRALQDDQLSRQSRKLRDAAPLGGPAGELYVLVEGSPEAIVRADGLVAPLGRRLSGADAEGLYRRLKDEDEAASAGMGLFFTE